MKLAWISYSGGPKPRRWLVVVLGEKDEKLYCLDADPLPQATKDYLRAKARYLDVMSLEERITDIKENQPQAMVSFRTIHKAKVSIEREFEIKPQSTLSLDASSRHSPEASPDPRTS